MGRVRTSTSAPVPPLELPDDPVADDVDVATDHAPQPATVETTREPGDDPDFDEAYAQQMLKERKTLESIFNLLAEGRQPNAAQLAVLRKWGPRDKPEFDKWTRKESTRCANVKQLQQQAGSGIDRQQAQAEAEKAESELARQAPQIQAEIDALRTRLARLENEARRLRSASDARQAAVAELQQPRILPAFVQDDLRLANDRQNRDWKADLVAAESRAVALRQTIALDPEARENRDMVRLHIEGIQTGTDTKAKLQRFYWTTEERHFGGPALEVGKLRRDVWDAYVADLRRELADVEATIARLEPMEATAAAEVERLRSYYVPQ